MSHHRVKAGFLSGILVLSCSACHEGAAAPAPSTTPAPPTTPVTYTLSGVISEVTPTGHAPVSGALVEVAVCPTNLDVGSIVKTATDGTGAYSVNGVCAGNSDLWVTKAGYRTDRKGAPPCDGDCLIVPITGNTRLDVELVRQ